MNSVWNLTDREYEILKLVVEGFSNPEISEKLFISTHTVKAHIASIYEKTGIHSRVVLAVRAVKLGVIIAENVTA